MLRKIFRLLIAGHFALARAAAPGPAPSPASPDSTAITANAAPASSGIIHVGGSDLLQTAVGEPLTRYIKDRHLKDVSVDMLGSVPAMDGLKSGKVQLALVAAPIGQKPAPDGFKAIPFCFAVDYIIVNQANPLTALDLRQLSGIFGGISEDIGSWGQLKLGVEWTSRPIIPYSTSPDDGIVVEMLKFLALDRKPLRSSVHVLNTPDETISTVASSPNAIGLVGYDPGPASKDKVLLISPDKEVVSGGGHPAARATPENVFSGDYPLRLPFYLVYNPADKARVLPLLRLLLGDDYVKSLRDAHFMPLPDIELNRARLGLDKQD